MTGLLRSTWRVLASKEEKPMDLMDATSGKYAVKRYKADCPSEYQIRQLIDAAVMAPGAVDGQSWHFTVITNAEMLDTISARTKSWIFHHEPWLLEGGERTWPLNDANFHLLHHAPVLIVIAAPSKDKWSAEICVVAAQNLMLAATAHGLAACWIGLAQNWLNSPAGRTAVGLPDDVRSHRSYRDWISGRKPRAHRTQALHNYLDSRRIPGGRRRRAGRTSLNSWPIWRPCCPGAGTS